MRRTKQTDESKADRMLACPKCGDLCEEGYVLCFECGARLLPTERWLKQLRGK